MATTPTSLNKDTIENLPIPKSGNTIHRFPDAQVQGTPVPRGLGVRVTPNGAKAWVLGYSIGGVDRRMTLGKCSEWSATDAVKEAKKLRQRIDRGDDPMTERRAQSGFPVPISVTVLAPVVTVETVLETFITRHVGTLRTAKSVESALRRLVLPAIGAVPIYEVRRGKHLTPMLDNIEANQGPVQASRIVAYLAKCFNWWATRDDDFTSPMIRGMARSKASERARDRTLSDDEIRAIWKATEAGTFGALVRMLLLTGQRRGEVAGMRRSEIDQEGVWTIPAARYKTKRAHAVPLSTAALEIVAAQPAGDVVFPSVLGTPFSGYDKPKKALDKISGTSGWTLHDLRRTSKTLMQRADVRPDISERVLGHALGTIEGTYDRHSYIDEKRLALAKLATMVEKILDPPEAANVVPIRA